MRYRHQYSRESSHLCYCIDQLVSHRHVHRIIISSGIIDAIVRVHHHRSSSWRPSMTSRRRLRHPPLPLSFRHLHRSFVFVATTSKRVVSESDRRRIAMIVRSYSRTRVKDIRATNARRLSTRHHASSLRRTHLLPSALLHTILPIIHRHPGRRTIIIYPILLILPLLPSSSRYAGARFTIEWRKILTTRGSRFVCVE